MGWRRKLCWTIAAFVPFCYFGSGAIATWVLTRPQQPFAEPAPPGWDALRIHSDVEVGAWWRSPEDADRVVVLVHGNGASRTDLLPIGNSLLREGCAILSVTLRAHGDSASTQNDIGWSARHDVVAAVREARRRRPALNVYVYGVSMGAAAILFASEELSSDIAGAVLVAPYADLKDAVRRRTQKYLPSLVESLAYHALRTGGRLVLPNMDRIAPILYADALSVPALLIAGDIDDRAPPVDSHKLALALPRATVLVAEGLQHEDMSDLREHDAWEGVLAFLHE